MVLEFSQSRCKSHIYRKMFFKIQLIKESTKFSKAINPQRQLSSKRQENIGYVRFQNTGGIELVKPIFEVADLFTALRACLLHDEVSPWKWLPEQEDVQASI